MVKHTQIIRWLLATNCLSVFDHFVVLALIGLTYNLQLYYKRGSGIDFFLWILWIFLGTSFSWNTSWKLLLKGEFYENSQTDIFIIKRYREIYNSFKYKCCKRRGSLWEPFHKSQYCTYKEFFIYARKKKVKSLKDSSKKILLLVKLQAEGFPF